MTEDNNQANKDLNFIPKQIGYIDLGWLIDYVIRNLNKGVQPLEDVCDILMPLAFVQDANARRHLQMLARITIQKKTWTNISEEKTGICTVSGIFWRHLLLSKLQLFLQMLDNAGKEFAKMRHYFTGVGIGHAQGHWYLVGNGLFHM